MTTISEIDIALEYLRGKKCWRDNGLWFSVDGPLDSDPVVSAKLFRRRLVQAGIERHRDAAGNIRMTR